MPPTTTYPQSYDTSPQTADRFAHRINGARIASPALDRRYRPAFLPAFSGMEASRLYEGKRKLSERHRASRRAEHSPTVTVEQDPNPPPVYTPTLPLHASIVPLASTSTSRSGSRASTARTRTSDSIIFIFIAIFVVAFLSAVFLIFKIRRNRRKREESRTIPVKNGPPSPRKVRPWMVAADGTALKKSSSEGSTVHQEKCVQNAPPPHDLATSPFVVSSGSLDSSSYTASSHSSSGHLEGFFSSSCMTITEKVDLQKRDIEDKGVPYALSYVESGSDVSDGSDRDSVKTMTIDPVEPLILDASTDYVCPDPSLDGPTYGLESSYDSETANQETCTSIDFYRLETAHSRCMETVQAVLVRCPAAATPEVTTDPISAQSEVALPSLLLTSPPSENDITCVVQSTSCEEVTNSTGEGLSLAVAQASSGTIFGLHSTSSTVTVDLNEFPEPPTPIPRVEVTLPQVDLEFPIYVWDEDSDMLTVHKKKPGPILDQFISLYS